MATSVEKEKMRESIARLVTKPVDIASLAFFRILFGLLMASAIVRFMAKGWVRELYVQPKFHFTYPGFEWIHPWPEPYMQAHFILLALAAIGVAAGFFYRSCITLFFVGFTYLELIDQTAYLNHYYLISLLSGLMIFLPADRAWSFDAWRNPQRRLEAAPAWALNILRFQIGVVYVFAGLAKFNADWLFHAQPLRIWLAARSELPIIGSLLAAPWVAYAGSWFGAIFDTSIVGFLLWRPARKWAFAMVIFFHAATWVLFNIGMFPWIMIVAATLLFPADWPRHWLIRVSTVILSKAKSVKIIGRLKGALAIDPLSRVMVYPASPLLVAVLSLYAAVQLTLPLRPYLMHEPSAWTCSGFNCAWRVMIAEKTGYAEFYACDPPSGREWKLNPENYLTPRQEVMMAQDPYLIRQMARRLAADLRAQGLPQVEVRANAFATLNGRPSQQLFNSQINLAAALPPDWILPLAR